MTQMKTLATLFLTCINLLSVSAQIDFLKSKEQLDFFKPARFYDRKGNKVEGLIDYKGAPKLFILFKETPDVEPAKIMASNIIGMVIAQDTFATIYMYQIGGEDFEPVSYVTNGFGQVLETGKITLYKVEYNERDKGYLVQAGKNRPFLVKIELEKFMKQMAKFMKDQPEIVAKINNREYSYFKLQELIHDYNVLAKNTP
jgi:hypothetical protein